MDPIPYGKQSISETDIKAVEEVLRSDFLTQGPKVKEFEDAFANYVGSKYAVAVANGTAALHLSAMALNVQPGDKVITTPITFAATANCVRYCGGEVVFADIDPETYLLDINEARKLLEAAPKGTYKGIIPVDFAGLPVNLEEYRKLADEYDLWLLEDACHAPGGYFTDSQGQKQHCGNGHYADLAIFSFHPVKHIAAGEGGMITTNNEELYNKLQLLRTHGIHKDADQFQNEKQLAVGNWPLAKGQQPTAKGQQPKANSQNQYPAWYYEMFDLGYNYRLSEMHAALGLSQLNRADENLAKRREIAQKYDEALTELPDIKTPLPANSQQPKANSQRSTAKEGHAYHLYVIQTSNRLSLHSHLKEQNILAQVHYIPLHLMPYYQDQGWKAGDLPNAEAYYQGCLSIPMYHGMTEEEQDFVIETIRKMAIGD